MNIETNRLRIVPCNPEILGAAIAGNGTIAQKLGVVVPENWTEFGTDALRYAQDKLVADASELAWWTYLPIHKKENKLIGSGGYMGKPNDEGAVEIGYEIAPDYRNQGLATEFSQALIDHAFSQDKVQRIYAHTLGEINPSTQVLMKLGFEKVEELIDPNEGPIWKWTLLKANYFKR